ncbi:MAG: CinA family nicotinamide mononucleotide deamidase-related protein [Bacteroidales bacterium]|nr:CinA family nicotinamide mononucleotide deamidase-related protein [Bacteroidales bacterium]
MTAQIITIGDELLIGQTIDTNSAWIGAELTKTGFDVTRRISIHDLRDDIIDTLNEVSGRSDVILITGGLGPTSDDITKQTLCEFFETRFVTDYDVLEMIEGMMKRRGFPMNDNNRRQAEVPESCRVLKNATGTAPGMWFEKQGSIFISMPGVPYEMKYIMQEHVLPELNKRFSSRSIKLKNIMTYGAPEALLAELLTGFEASLPGEIKLAYLPSSGIIKLRLTAKGDKTNLPDEMLQQQVEKLYRTIPELIIAEDEENFETVIGKLLREKGLSVCTSESCTGGRIAHMLTSVPGSSAYYHGSVIAYDNKVKTSLLGVPQNVIDRYGAVSSETVALMAEGARKILQTDFSVATSGIAGPDGGTETKPVGTLWTAVSSASGTITQTYRFGTERSVNILRFSTASLHLLWKQISGL